MKAIDEAGSIAAMRHCQEKENYETVAVALARVDEITFTQPMYVGEFCTASAEVTFTSKRSIEVKCEVIAENLQTGEKRVTNVANLWYVPVLDVVNEEVGSSYGKVLRRKNIVAETVKQLHLEPTVLSEATTRYEQQIISRKSKADLLLRAPRRDKKSLTLAQLVLPDDCIELGNVQGGAILKLVDSAAGIVAFRHAMSNAVTASTFFTFVLI